MDTTQQFRLPQDFSGMTEVTETSEGSAYPVIDGGEIEANDITEVTTSSSIQKINVIKGGNISSWETSEATHKVQMRMIITFTTLALWVALTIAGLITFFQTGNPSLLITSPAAATGMVIYKILGKLVAYYYS